MKTKSLSTLLLFCISSITYSQKTNPIQLQNFVGKQVMSIVEITLDTRSSTIGINDKNIETIPTGRKQVTKRLINFQKEGQEIKSTFTIQHIKATIYGGAGESIYDSDNAFERSSIASTFGSVFDPVIGKKYSAKYDNNGKILVVLNDATFERGWNIGLPKMNDNVELSGLFQMSVPMVLEVGKTWVDTLNGRKVSLVNSYKIIEINDEVLKIMLTGKSKSILTNEEQRSSYDGVLEVIKTTGFIQKIELSRESETLNEVMGTKISSITTTKTIVRNSVK
jgi:hypothetical protein